MKKSMIGSLSVAVAGGGLLVACAPTPAPAPAPVPAPGCYTGDSNADLLVLGAVGTAGALETYDVGSDCTTNDTVALLSITYVEGADAVEAEEACVLLDAENDTWIDLADASTPAPGLAGYWSCSDKS